MIHVSESFRSSYPGARLGLLAMNGVSNPSVDSQLEVRKAEVERELRGRYQGLERAQLKQLPTVQAYVQYYGRFEKTYHLLLQLESVALKGKPIPSVAALVEAMFMAEIKNMLLTAGHDLTKLALPLTLGAAPGSLASARGAPSSSGAAREPVERGAGRTSHRRGDYFRSRAAGETRFASLRRFGDRRGAPASPSSNMRWLAEASRSRE